MNKKLQEQLVQFLVGWVLQYLQEAESLKWREGPVPILPQHLWDKLATETSGGSAEDLTKTKRRITETLWTSTFIGAWPVCWIHLPISMSTAPEADNKNPMCQFI